jgi:DNA-binding PadR family transcriptional regulator
MPRKADDKATLNATAASLLGFLSRGPMSGYDLAATIEDSIGPFWNVTRSQIYRELRMLEEAGFLRAGASGTRDRRSYTVTAAGQRAFDAWISRDLGEELIRFPLLLTIYFGDRVPPAELRRILRLHRARHESALATYRKKETRRAADPFPALTLRFGIIYEEAVLHWFDSIRLPSTPKRRRKKTN